MPEFLPGEYDYDVFPEYYYGRKLKSEYQQKLDMNADEYDALMADLDREQKSRDEIEAEVKKQNEAWKAKWPNYCRKCGGWGLIGEPPSTPEDPGPDPCDAFGEEDRCHRCGGELEPVYSEAGDPENGPRLDIDSWKCKACSWSWDDGLMQEGY
jgi:hypothetical protein